jgi:hypothetical protein
MEAYKMDQKSIDDYKNYMKWALKEIEDKLTEKCSEEELNKQRITFLEKISILHENLT